MHITHVLVPRYGWKNSDVHPKGSLFGILQEHLTKGGIASCIISGNSVNQAEVKNSGLYVKHYYSILQVRALLAANCV